MDLKSLGGSESTRLNVSASEGAPETIEVNYAGYVRRTMGLKFAILDMA